MENKIRVALIEDHPEYREIIELAIDRESDMEMVDTFGTTERALRTFDADHTTAPDILLLDLSLPGAGGLESIPAVKVIIPDTRILILSQSDSEKDVLQAISRGASGYLLKSSTVRQIITSIRNTMIGGNPLDSKVAKYIVDTLRNQLSGKEKEDLLSNREMDVLTLLAEGMTQKEIADHLGISPTTVITHLGHIYEKLDAKNAPAAVARAFGFGILPTDKKG